MSDGGATHQEVDAMLKDNYSQPVMDSPDPTVVSLPKLEAVHNAVCEVCSICGHAGVVRKGLSSPREGYACRACRASLRYRDQAAVILALHESSHATLAGLAASEEFQHKRIYEPGLIGPFRALFEGLPGYQTSYFWRDAERGELRDGVMVQDLERLTFDDESFELVITSDIFEHIFDPWAAFDEVQRVLAPGGVHVCSIPLDRSVGSLTAQQAQLTEDGEVVHLGEPRYHGSPTDPEGSLVCTNYGMDLPDLLEERGIDAAFVQGHLANVTLVCRK